MAFTQIQPKDQDRVLTCDHVFDSNAQHFFKIEHSVQVIGPEGPVNVQWLVCCEECLQKSGADVRKVAWNHLRIWKGDEPIIEEPSIPQ